MVERSTDDTFSTTPETMNFFKDARDMEGAGKYPNYWTHKTRSGHVFMLDDSKGAEHVTLQHRTGSMIQFMPDGAVQFTSHNGEYNMVFGAKRVKITGAYDITVEKAASLRVEGGDYNVTVPNGSVNYTIGKNFNIITGENFNVHHGKKFEKIAILIYESIYNVKVGEFGLVPHLGNNLNPLAIF